MSILLGRYGEDDGQTSHLAIPTTHETTCHSEKRKSKKIVLRPQVEKYIDIQKDIQIYRKIYRLWLFYKEKVKERQNTKPTPRSPVYDGMKAGISMLFCLESQKSNKCQAILLSLSKGINRDTIYSADACFYAICRSLVTFRLANGFKIKQVVEIQ